MFFGSIMPEIWLNYGNADVVLDIRAENLDQEVNSQGNNLDETLVNEKLDQIDLSKQIELVVLNNSKSIQKIISKLYQKCEEKTLPKPKILASKKILHLLKSGLPQESQMAEFHDDNLNNSSLIFVGEMEFDGLFGFETIATRLLKKFGEEKMLEAYEKRKGNSPSSGDEVENIHTAQKFADSFEISAIEVAANSSGIIDFTIGHPSKTMSISKTFRDSTFKEVEKHRTMMISTGKDSSNDTLGRSLNSLWNCNAAIKDNGLAILLAECTNGFGSQALAYFIEGRLNLDRLKKPSKYVSGMEDLLFLTEIQKRFDIGLVSILPQFYTKKLNIKAFDGVKQAMDNILKVQGINQKVAVVSDGARLLLR